MFYQRYMIIKIMFYEIKKILKIKTLTTTKDASDQSDILSITICFHSILERERGRERERERGEGERERGGGERERGGR